MIKQVRGWGESNTMCVCVWVTSRSDNGKLIKRKRPTGETDVLVHAGNRERVSQVEKMAYIKTDAFLQSFHYIILADTHVTLTMCQSLLQVIFSR